MSNCVDTVTGALPNSLLGSVASYVPHPDISWSLSSNYSSREKRDNRRDNTNTTSAIGSALSSIISALHIIVWLWKE
eukprot:scaffold3829_cov85-Skeletonema_menzelii.AAC.4